MNGQWELADVEGVIEREIEMGATQREVAKSYALGLLSTWPTDWERVNARIIARWSKSGLLRIKNLAWSGKCFSTGDSA